MSNFKNCINTGGYQCMWEPNNILRSHESTPDRIPAQMKTLFHKYHCSSEIDEILKVLFSSPMNSSVPDPAIFDGLLIQYYNRPLAFFKNKQSVMVIHNLNIAYFSKSHIIVQLYLNEFKLNLSVF